LADFPGLKTCSFGLHLQTVTFFLGCIFPNCPSEVFFRQ
jgi:hypothetical protein